MPISGSNPNTYADTNIMRTSKIQIGALYYSFISITVVQLISAVVLPPSKVKLKPAKLT